MIPIALSARAAREIGRAAAWYAARGGGLALDFRDALDRAFDLVSRVPDAGSTVKMSRRGPLRQVFTQGFPYRIVYRRSAATVLILAVLHTRRSPSRLP